MSISLIVLLCWSLAVCVIFYRARGSFMYFLRGGVDKVTRLSEEEHRRRWPTLRKTLRRVKEMDQAFGAVATLILDDRRERELTETEQLANLALFHADPRLAQELGYEVPEHTCRWSRAYRAGEPPGPFTCHVCGQGMPS